MKLKWKKEPGSAVQAPISHGGDAHDYVISHRRDQHTVSHNPPGKHEHVGTFVTEKEARAAAEAHTPSQSPAPSLMPTPRKESRAMPQKKKSSKQLDREIASNLSARGQPQLADLFADPAARQTFANEMRHALQTQQTSRVTAEAKAARPFTVKRVETTVFIDGERRVRSLVGHFATESEARAVADRVDGWVETRDGKVIYSREAHATKKAASKAPARPTPYRLKLTPGEMRAVEHARGRYAWPDMLAAHAAEDGSVAFTESDMWQWTDDVDSDTEGGHSPFPLAAGGFAEKLQSFYDERI